MSPEYLKNPKQHEAGWSGHSVAKHCPVGYWYITGKHPGRCPKQRFRARNPTMLRMLTWGAASLCFLEGKLHICFASLTNIMYYFNGRLYDNYFVGENATDKWKGWLYTLPLVSYVLAVVCILYAVGEIALQVPTFSQHIKGTFWAYGYLLRHQN